MLSSSMFNDTVKVPERTEKYCQLLNYKQNGFVVVTALSLTKSLIFVTSIGTLSNLMK